MGQPVMLFEIGCRDRDRTQSFYTTLFDWGHEPYGPFSVRLKTGSAHGIQGFITALGHEPHSYVMMYVQVDDIPAVLARAESLGGTTVIPPTAAPGGGQFAWLTDPEGRMVGLWNPAG